MSDQSAARTPGRTPRRTTDPRRAGIRFRTAVPLALVAAVATAVAASPGATPRAEASPPQDRPLQEWPRALPVWGDRAPAWEIVAHRGGVIWGPEHTLSTIGHALDVAADAIELDVRFTRDDVAVVLHDQTLDRTTDCTGRVHRREFASLRGCDAGGWFSPRFAGERVLSLDDALAHIAARSATTGVFLHVKTSRPGHAEAMVDALHRHGFDGERGLVLCDGPACVDRVRAAGAQHVGMVFNSPAGWRSTDVPVLVPYNLVLDPARLATARARGQLVLPVENHPHPLTELADFDVAGVIADDLDAAVRRNQPNG